MAEYTNLTSLEGLKPGDIVKYNATTPIDFKGYKVKVELYGHTSLTYAAYSSYTYKNGYYVLSDAGKTEFLLDSSKLNEKILSFNNDNAVASSGTATYRKRCDLIYGDTDDLYYRIAVAGGAGSHKIDTSNQYFLIGGVGGGQEGGKGDASRGSKAYKATGGSQTSGGSTRTWASYTTYKGAFGAPGIVGSEGNTAGGYGWYAGGGGGMTYDYDVGAAGGSGFIIGVSTTTYPAGYLGDNIALQNTIINSISEGVLTTGQTQKYQTGYNASVKIDQIEADIVSASTYDSLEVLKTPMMILTVIESTGGSSNSQLQYYNGTEFVPTNINYYNGTEFVLCDAYYYDGTEFKKI